MCLSSKVWVRAWPTPPPPSGAAGALRPEDSEMNGLEMQHISHVCTQSTWNFYSQELLFKRTKRLKIRKIGLLMYENVTAVFTSTVSLVHLSCILLKFHVGEETGLQIGSRFFLKTVTELKCCEYSTIRYVQRGKPNPQSSCTAPRGFFLEGIITSPELNLDPGLCSGKSPSSSKGFWSLGKVPAVKTQLWTAPISTGFAVETINL